MLKISILLFSLFLARCNDTSDVVVNSQILKTIDTALVNTSAIKMGIHFDYDLDNPAKIMILDSKLNEISSLGYDQMQNTLIANNDELGTYYHLDLNDGTINSAISFGKKGDYEGIEKIGNEVFILKSNGKLYAYNEETSVTSHLDNKLKAKNDVEGLAFDETSGLLLLACKGQSIKDTKTKKKKVIYGYNLKNKILQEEAFLTVHDSMLVKQVDLMSVNSTKSKIKILKKRVKEFAPSGIAVHPKSKEYYIISAKGSTMVIIDRNKTIRRVHFLNNKIIPQPEGITFDADGNLYIATEGQGFRGKIFKFNL